MKTFWLIFVCLANYPALSQINHGTLVVTRTINGKLIVAADSLGIDGEGPHYNQCKIAVLKHEFVFASSGAVGYSAARTSGVESWNNWGEALFAVRTASTDPSKSSERIDTTSNLWASRVATHWAHFYAVDPKAIEEEVRHFGPVITIGYFATIENGVPYHRYIRILFNPSEPHITTVQDDNLSGCIPEYCALGMVVAFTKFRTGISEHPEAHTWNPSPELLRNIDRETLRVMRLVDLAIAYEAPNELGGPVDALEFWFDGTIHWVTRKQNCPDNED